jgi:hypothetical protein
MRGAALAAEKRQVFESTMTVRLEDCSLTFTPTAKAKL